MFVEVIVVIRTRHPQIIFQAIFQATNQLVENVKVPFQWILRYYPGFFQQKVGNLASCGLTRREQNFHVPEKLHSTVQNFPTSRCSESQIEMKNCRKLV